MRRIVPALACLALAVVGCRHSPPDYAYSYHKDQISQEQLLQDERTLETMRGVKRVTTKHNQDGSATIEVAVEPKERMTIQQKLSTLGYVRGQH